MQVRRNRNTIQCILNADDLEKYDIHIDEMKNGNIGQEYISSKISDIILDVNEELDDEDKLDLSNQMLSIDMSLNPRSNSVLMNINIHSEDEYDGIDNDFVESQKTKPKTFNRDEIKDIAFSFKNMNEIIAFAKQLSYRDALLKEKSKTMTKDDIEKITVDDPDFAIPDDFPGELKNFFEHIRNNVVDTINNEKLQDYKKIKNFKSTSTSLYKMNDLYYFICKDVAYNDLLGIPEEYYLGDIEKEPSASYVIEHGEVIIKDKVLEKLSQL